jgi:hypothetical protein
MTYMPHDSYITPDSASPAAPDKAAEFIRKGCDLFIVNCNDVFAPCSDCEAVASGDLPIFVAAYTKHGWDGVNALLSLKRECAVQATLRTLEYMAAREEYKNHVFQEL